MPGQLNRSPAQIMQKLVIDLELGQLHTSTTWPTFIGDEPDTPNNVITIYDTRGTDNGDDMYGEKAEHYGFQVRIRSKNYPEGYEKAQAIAIAMDSINNKYVHVGAQRYLVKAITRSGNVLQLRTEKILKSNQKIFVFNALASIRKVAS